MPRTPSPDLQDLATEIAAAFPQATGDELDDDVQDAASREASAANNGGLHAQIAYLLAHGHTADDVRTTLTRYLRQRNHHHQYLFDILHNITRTDEGRLAIYDRDEGPRARPDDTLQRVGTLTVEAASLEGALEAVYEAGNAPFDTPQVREYRSWRVRSVSFPGNFACCGRSCCRRRRRVLRRLRRCGARSCRVRRNLVSCRTCWPGDHR